MSTKQERLEAANKFLIEIGSCGRRFFYSAEFDRYAYLKLDARGRVWFVDDYTGEAVYTHKTTWQSQWRGFSHGGTLRALVEALRKHVVKGSTLWSAYLVDRGGNFPHPWDYGDDLEKVRQAGLRLGIVTPTPESAP